MSTIIAELVERLALPPDGIDLRAELDALQSARVGQALAQAGGDVGRAAQLLRMSRLELMRLEARLSGPSPGPLGRRRFEPLAPPAAPSVFPRIDRGVELISAAVIRGLSAEGYTERQIARRLGCNVFIVEKALREQTEGEVRRLDAEGRDRGDIASTLRLPLSRVRRILDSERSGGDET
jgi:hypothetical protein